MVKVNYNFEKCKLCKDMSAEPTYDLGDKVIYVCQKCDFHFINHLDCSSVNSSDTKLSEQSSAYIDARLAEGNQNHQQRLELVQKHIGDLSAINALDIGAGVGQFNLKLRDHGAKTWGIEPSTLRRQYAEKKFGLTLNSELVDDIYWQGEFENHFDIITLWDVIEHVDFPAETLAAAGKLLKTGGMLFLDTPSRLSLSYRLSEFTYRFSSKKMYLFLPNYYSTNLYGHKQIFTPLQLQDLLRHCGIKTIKTTNYYSKKSSKTDKIIITGEKTNQF